LIIKTNREYDRIYEKWLTADDPWRTLEKYLWPAIITVIAITLIAGFWLVMLQLLVKKRTRQLSESNEMLHLAQEGLEERWRSEPPNLPTPMWRCKAKSPSANWPKRAPGKRGQVPQLI